MAIEKELKNAIINMPSSEKDKLLLRLVQKDKVLVERLFFELVEEKETLNERRETIKEIIRRGAGYNQYSAGLLMMSLRDLSGVIACHVKITKDTYGEVELFVYMLNQFYANHADLLQLYNGKSDTCALYIAKKTQSILAKVAKVNEDYYVDFEGPINTLLDHIHTSCAKFYAKEFKIPQSWP